MFQKIKYHLLFSYLLVLASILGVFTIAVRIFFTHSLERELIEKLTDLGELAAASAHLENGRIKFENEFNLKEIKDGRQALQWFDAQGNLIDQQGTNILQLPLSRNQVERFKIGNNSIQAITLPIIGSEDNQIIGYIRVSESLEYFDKTLNKLDWGLGSGIVFALLFSGFGGVWLTRQAMQPIEESFQRLKQFTADASHELRSPVMAIKTNASVAIKYAEGIRETDLEKFQAILSATNQMSRLTDDLLFLTRTDKIPHKDKSSVSLTEIINDLIQLYQPQAAAKQISLQGELSKNLHLLGDTSQLIRLFTNLIENSIHYTPVGGMIEIKTSHVGSNIYVNIQDTGVGIATDNLDKIFDRFWRADESRSYHSGGSGLGLAIAQAIAKHHGGLITVKSQLGVGSCFTVRLSADLKILEGEKSKYSKI